MKNNGSSVSHLGTGVIFIIARSMTQKSCTFIYGHFEDVKPTNYGINASLKLLGKVFNVNRLMTKHNTTGKSANLGKSV